MQVQREREIFTPEAIERIPEALGFQDPEKEQFDQLVLSLKNAQAELFTHQSLTSQRLEMFILQSREASRSMAEGIQAGLEQQSTLILTDQTDIRIVTGRIQVELFRRRKPLFFRLFGGLIDKLAKVGEPVSEHPMLTPLKKEATEAQNQLLAKKQEAGIEAARIHKAALEQTRSLQSKLLTAEEQMLDLVLKKAITSSAKTIMLINLVPVRATAIAYEYAEKMHGSREELTYFRDFLSKSPQIMWGNLNRRQRVQRLGVNQEWIHDEDEMQVPTPGDFRDINPEIQRYFRKYVETRIVDQANKQNR